MTSWGLVCLWWLCYAAGVNGDKPITQLVTGDAVEGSINAHEYAYYSTPGIEDLHKDLTVAVTPLTGDPDLYISLNKYPSITNYTWSRAHLGGDTLTIPAEDFQACGAKPGCTYYIAVYGYADASFTIVASWTNAEPVKLRLGQPQADHVGTGAYKQYSIQISPSAMTDSGTVSDLQVLVNPTLGDSDLYVTLDGSRPLSDHFDYRSAGWGDSQDRVVVHHNDTKFIEHCASGTCTLRAAVYGFHDSDYTIVVSAYAEALLLQHGVPLESTVPPATYQRFTAAWDTAVDDLIISLSPKSGQPRLYVACQPIMPNSTSFTWSLDTARTDTNLLRLNTTTASSHGCKPPATVAMALISDTLSSYTIMATIDAASSVPLLVPGTAVFGQAKYGKMSYYQIRLGQTYIDVNVMLTVRSGEVDLYVSNSWEGRPVYDAESGVVSNYTLSSTNDGDDRVSITHSHFDHCAPGEPCYYIVGVLGNDYQRNEFSIVAKLEESIITLQDGVAVRDFVGPRMYEYFRVTVVDPRADLTISTTPFSGDPDLYVSLAPDHPNKENHTWASRGFGADTLTLQSEALKEHCTPDPMAGRGCDYFIGVYGWTNTSFSIMASLNMGWQNPMMLSPGQPQTGHVDKGSYQYYEIYVPAELQSPVVHILLTPEDESDQDVYVTMSPDKEPGKGQYDYKAVSWELADEVVITPTSSPYCVDCTIYIAVYGYEGGDYTLSVSLSNDQTTLQIGVPVRGSVADQGSMFYSVDWQSFIDDLVLTLNAESGQPQLYASCKEPFPNATKHDWALDTREDGSILRLNGTGGAAHGCQPPAKLWVSVASVQTLSSYTLLASTDASSSVPLLVPGAQVAGDVKFGKMSYYQVRLGKTYQDVDVILTVKAGEVDLYVSDSYEGRPVLDPYNGVVNYTMKSELPGDDRITVTHSHFRNCEQDCYYIIAVLGKDYKKNEFSIVAKLEESTITLQDGVAIKDFVGPHLYEYFRVKVVDPDADLTISTTPFSGDPDLYVSVAPIYHPTKENHTWASRGFGADTLTLQAEALKEHCTPNPAAGRGCDYYIGVYGWTNTSFSIMASLNMGWQNPMMLFPGQPQTGHVEKGSYQYYMLYLSEEAAEHEPSIKVTLVPTEGADQDLYVSMSRDKEPGKSQYDYKATSWSGTDEVVIRPGMAGYCTGCKIFLAVYGYQEGDYQISGTISSDHTKLQMGVPVQSALSAHSTDYFSVGWPSPVDDLVVTLTEQSGMPLLYASCSEPFPNDTAHDWKLDTREESSNLLRINMTEAQAAHCLGSGATVYMSVSSASSTSMVTYSIMAWADLSSAVPVLVPGVQMTGHVKFGRMSYYQVRVGKTYQDVDVILTVKAGEVDMYVSDSYDGRPVYSPETGVTNYTMSSEQEGSDRLLIKHSHFSPCTVNCYYIIGLLGRKYTKNQFTIVAKKVDSTITLQDGVAIRDFVGPHLYEYFRVTVIDPDADLTISTTPFSGDPDLYVSPAPVYHPTKENHTWASRGFGADTLTLQAEALKEHCTPDPTTGTGCDYFIGVYGWTNTSFSIMASLNMGWQNPMMLFPGQPQTGSVETGSYQYYEYYVSGSTQKVRFVLTSEGDADMDLYLSVSRDKEPGKNQYDLKSTTWAGDDEINFSPSDAAAVFCTDCTVYLGVFGYIGGDYTLSVGGAGFQTLQSAVPVTGQVDAGTAAYYRVHNGNPEAHVVISVTTLSGDPDLYVLKSQSGEDGSLIMPSKSKYDWKGNRVGDDAVEVMPSDPNFCSSCEYLIAVYGWTNTSFTITATVEQLFVIPLAPGRPQTGRVEAGGVRYFYATLGNSAEDLRVSLTLLTGDGQLFISEGLDMDHLPDPNKPATYKYKSQPASGGNAVLRVPGPHTNTTSFAIAVLGLDQADFILTASLEQTPVMLQEGVPMQQAVTAGRMEYFVYTITSRADITVTVTAIQGDPDVAASTQFDRPVCGEPVDGDSIWGHTCTNYTWISQAFSSDQLIIRHDLPCEPSGHTRVAPGCTPDMVEPGQDLYIGVFGFDESVFTITLTTGGGHSSLVAGRPQHGTTSEGAVCAQRTESGSCDTSGGGGTWSSVEVSYFKFRVSPDDLDKDSNAHVSIVLEPACNTTVSPCAPGCPCNPLTVYVQSCVESECTVMDMYPSSLLGQHHVVHVADAAHSTLFIAHDPSNPHNGFCDPRKLGEVCYYYIAVAHNDEHREASFSISASTPKDVNVLPTRTNPAPPDGIVTSSLDAVHAASKKYQMYANKGSSMLLSLEACTGDLSLAVCDGSCPELYPTSHDYKYYADSTKTCSRAGCNPSVAAVPRIAMDKVTDDTYFLAVEGTGTYYLRVETSGGSEGNRHLAPILAPPASDTVPAVSEVKADSVTISWKPAQVFLAGGSGENRVTPQRTRYRVYAFDDKMLAEAIRQQGGQKPIVATACGLEHYAASQAGAAAKVAMTDEAQTSFTMQGLTPGVSYRFVVAAICDADCLRHVSKVTPSSTLGLTCGGAVPCQDQTALYSATYVQTAMSAGGSGARGGGSHSSAGILVSLLVLVLVLTLVGMGLLYRKNRRLEQQLQYEMTDVQNLATPVTSSRRSSSDSPSSSPKSSTSFLYRPPTGLGGTTTSGGKAYQPLLTDDEVEDNYRRV